MKQILRIQKLILNSSRNGLNAETAIICYKRESIGCLRHILCGEKYALLRLIMKEKIEGIRTRKISRTPKYPSLDWYQYFQFWRSVQGDRDKLPLICSI